MSSNTLGRRDCSDIESLGGSIKACSNCNCERSNCLKMYCQCFSDGKYCNACNCQNCQNRPGDRVSDLFINHFRIWEEKSEKRIRVTENTGMKPSRKKGLIIIPPDQMTPSKPAGAPGPNASRATVTALTLEATVRTSASVWVAQIGQKTLLPPRVFKFVIHFF